MVQRNIPDSDGESKSLILNAAITEFGNSGFHGARIDMIAKRSGINKAMIYYHFKGKDKLYAAIIDRLFSQILEQVTTMARADLAPDVRVITMIENLSAFIGDMDDSMRKLMLWEIASGGKAFQKIAGPKFFKKVFPLIKDIFKDGVSKGVFRENINPVFTQMIIVGSIIFANSIHMVMKKSPIFKLIYGSSFRKEFTENLISIISKGVLIK